MSVANPSCTACPPADQLTALIRGQLPAAAVEEVTDHVGDCPGCQHRMDDLATAGDAGLSDVVRHLDKIEPPSNSAYWKALNRAEMAVTQSLTGDTLPPTPSELKLDFLQPSTIPGRLGVLGTFEVIRVVGRGGMGVVLHAFDPCLQRDVAVKILDPLLANNDTARQRFCREARAAAAVAHENIVTIFQVDEDATSGLPYLVMQLVNGESLDHRLRRVGRLSVAEAVRLGAQAAAGLASAHAGGLIHRDIKPGNILIEAGTDKVKITDFGLARATEDMKLTKSGFVAGTPLYMAPEQARGDDIDARADLFSLGSVLYETLAGQPPFEGKTPLAVLRRVADEAHPPLGKVNRDVPDWLEDIIDDLLEKNPADRFQTATEVATVFAAHLKTLEAGAAADHPAETCGILKARSSSRIWRRRALCKTKAGIAAGLLVGALAGVGGTLLAVGGVGTPPPAPSAAAAKPEDGPEPAGMLPVKSGAVWSLGINADGTLLAVGSENGRVSLWNPKNFKLLFDLHPEKSDNPAHRGPVWAVDFTPDGKKLVSASDDGFVKTWNLADGKEVNSLPVGTPVRSAAVSQIGNMVAVGDRFGGVRVFDLTTGERKFEYQQESTVNGVAFAPDGLSMASISTDGSVVLWEIAGRRKRFTLNGHVGPVYGLSFSEDGTRLATGSWDGNVIVWDLDTGSQKLKVLAHEEGVWAVQFSPCCGYLASSGQDGKTRFWNAETGEQLIAVGRHRGTVHAAKFGGTRDARVLATGGRDGTVRLWDLKTLAAKSGEH